MNLDKPWIVGLVGIAMIGGSVGSTLCYRILGRIGNCKDEPSPRVRALSGPTAGFIERSFFAVAIAACVPDIGTAMTAWVALKAQSHYQIFTKGHTQDHARLYRALLTSLCSMSFAILGGWAWKEGFTF